MNGLCALSVVAELLETELSILTLKIILRFIVFAPRTAKLRG